MISMRLKINALTNNKFWEATGQDNEFVCINCKKEIREGFICENNKQLVLCVSCGNDYPMRLCIHNKQGEHQHIRFIRNKEQINES